jgi:hypothetical protein
MFGVTQFSVFQLVRCFICIFIKQMKIIFSFILVIGLFVCKAQSYDSLSAAAFKEYGLQNFKLASSLYVEKIQFSTIR